MFKTKFDFSLAVLLALACALIALPAFADSQARIVRLSDVQGSVQIDKNTGLGFENAFLNLPLTQGTRLHTRATGRAEVEFEDGSTIRLAPNTFVVFSRLGLRDGGQRISQVELTQGEAYVNWMGKGADAFTLNFSHEKVELNRPAHFRVETSADLAKFAVYKGDVSVVGRSATVQVAKKRMATFDLHDDDKATFAKNISEDPFDAWDKQSLDYHNQYAKNNVSPYGYGASDLSYYGSFSNIAGYGMMWQPFFTGAGWNPFADGAWSFYPGFGYMWASAYPWGWLPYRYGNWAFVPSAGWMWQPGNWNSWRGVPSYIGTAPQQFKLPSAPVGSVRSAIVGKGGRPGVSDSQSSLLVSRGSASLGIPRGSVSSLSHLNNQVAKTGFAEIHSASAGAAQSNAAGYGSAHSAPSSGRSGGSAGRSMGGGHVGRN